MSLITQMSRKFPSLYSGALLGFEDEQGVIEVLHSHLFPYPDQYEGGSFKSKSGISYQQKALETLKKTGYGLEFLGWFQATISGNFVTPLLIECLILQQLQNKNAFLLIYNIAFQNCQPQFKALRFTKNFVNLYLDGKWTSKNMQTHNLFFLNIFEEIPIFFKNSSLVNLFLATHPIDDNFETMNFSSLNLFSNQLTTTLMLESLFGQIDSYNYDQNNFNYYQRQHQKEQTKISQWIQQRKLENLERSKKGEVELNLDEWKSIFKLPVEPSRYINILHSHSIDVFSEDVLKNTNDELKKSIVIERRPYSES